VLPDSLQCDLPVLAAPMAGGPTTPELVVAASAAGSLGFIPAGYRTPEQLAESIATVRAGTERFGVNVFVPQPVPVERDDYDRYALAIAPDAERYGVTLPPDPIEDDDHWTAKLELLRSDPVPVVSFTFGLPDSGVIRELQRAGSCVLQTVTSVAEALASAAAGVDALVVQSNAAGGHYGTFTPLAMLPPLALADLVAAIKAQVAVPLLAAGGVATSRDVAATIAAGADKVLVGTALLRAHEAGTSPTHATAIASSTSDTVVTRAFTGRPARAIPNGFIRRHEEHAPSGYPAIHHLTTGLRKQAAASGDPEAVHLWAGTGYRAAPVADILTALSDRC
jgi:NAD(P)H-dependent flavin oxidoreductase YrpB (nitropropane dioxygenase family)